MAFYQITPGGQGYQPFGDVLGKLVAVRGSSNSTLTWGGQYDIEIYDAESMQKVSTVEGYDEAMMPDLSPAGGRVIFKDDYDYGNILNTALDGSERACLTCETRKKEYQLSDDATTVTLDYDNIVKIEGVWKANAPNGVNYWKNTGGAPYGRTITVKPLDKSNAAARVPVIVTYRYIPGIHCNTKPHFNGTGDVIAYARSVYGSSSYTDYWAMRSDGAGKIRLTMTPGDDSYGESPSGPRLMAGGTRLLISSRDTPTGSQGLLVVKLNQRAVDFIQDLSDHDSDSDPNCAVVSANPNRAAYLLLVVLPLLAGLVVRRVYAR
jgi:hypothetical protein